MHVRKSLILTILGFLVICLLAPVAVHAAILEESVTRTYSLQDDHVDVTETVISNITDNRYTLTAGNEYIFLVFDPVINDALAVEKINKTIPTIKVVDQDGTAKKFTTETSGQNLLIKVKRDQGVVYGHSQTLTATYKSYSLSSLSGAIRDLYPPSFAKDFKFSDTNTTRTYVTHIIIPKKYGEINFVIPQKSLVDKGDNWEITFSQQELTQTIAWIQIGTTQYYQFEIKQPYSATTSIPLFRNTYTVLLPRNVKAINNTQTVKYSEISPAPDSVTQDSEGNLVAKFSIPANEAGEIVIKGVNIVENNKDTDITKAGSLSDLPAEMVANLTKPAKYWEVDSPEIQAVAKELKGNETDIYKLVAKTYDYVVSKIDYSEVKRFGINQRQGALKTLQGGAAVCMEYSDLFIALMRAEGVPARAAFGYGYDPRAGTQGDTAHQWAEVYMPGLNNWIAVDPTWGESGTAVIGGNLNHFYKYVAEAEPDTPAPIEVSFFGSLSSIANDTSAITADASIPTNVTYMSEEELLAKYPPPTGLAQATQSLTTSAAGIIATINLFVEKLAGSTLGLTGMGKDLFKAFIYFTPILLILIAIAIRKLLLRKKNLAQV